MPLLGVFVIGALGDVATTACVGAAALGRGLGGSTGLVTALPPFAGLGLAPLASLRFGGVDVRAGSLLENARALSTREAGILDPDLVREVEGDLLAAGARVQTGFLSGAAGPVASLASEEARSRRLSPREAIAFAKEALGRFRAGLVEEAAREGTSLRGCVVVHLASTEPRDPEAEALPTEEALTARLDDAARPLPASLLWAIATIESGIPYVNFTPSCGAHPPGLLARARRLAVPVAGRDGKTGETLLKAALAPMFAMRNLRVLSWAGYNILGNRDGQVLDDERARAAKAATKGSTLGAILGGTGLGSEHVRIDYVPSIGDWKTAWDHVHFEGFLGTRMALELTWRGADSILAAPLVLDLVRLVERAREAGESGPLPQLAAFFKDPLATKERALHAQMDMLLAWVGRLGTNPPR